MQSCIQSIPRVKHVGLAELGLEISRPCEDHPRDVGLVIRDEELHCGFSHFSHIVMPLFHAKSCESEGRLATTTVLLGQVHCELVQHIAGVALQCAKQGTIAVHH